MVDVEFNRRVAAFKMVNEQLDFQEAVLGGARDRGEIIEDLVAVAATVVMLIGQLVDTDDDE